jgi:hypothetical protein
LDKPDEHQRDELQAIGRSLQKLHQIPLILASYFEQETESQISPEVLPQGLPLVTSGYTNMADWYLPILRDQDVCVTRCPFSMRLANPRNLSILRVNPVTSFSRGFGQFWLQPIQDFSIPSDRIYQRISATELGTIDRSVLSNQVVIIVANYKEAGLDDYTKDYTTDVPLAIRWGTPLEQKLSKVFTGGERLAYATHHLMTRHFIIPIPDLWSILIAGTIAKGLQLRSHKQSYKRSRRRFIKIGLGTVGYGIVGLQVYLSANFLLPFLFPAVTLGLLVFPQFRKVK